ncbi:uncharacterized protein BYT42DRAFT_553735 [Radiomyces spectabilis]|uniref:uncharacterized protein n=1 Tax=Radiomyces spectabilis TaxID=64574 RepID=UPI002220F496|nr:uncharacterized protein BYT42DRAFT_553735 [Radiomyces spectabilis]KAI8394220.1 hypothetical protein BYT42DRAFT_553735 [Radiomyces spectabilis]
MATEEDREHKLSQVLETYFSDANLLWDKIMQAKIAADVNGYVPFTSLQSLKKFKALDVTAEEIKSAAEKYSLNKLELSSDKSSIRRIKPFVPNKKEELDDWSIYVEGLQKPYDQEQNIRELLRKWIGHISFVRYPADKVGNTRFWGYCFVEFDDQANVDKAVRLLNRYNVDSEAIDEDLDPADKEQIDKLNLRVMSKNKWNDFKAQYLRHQKERKADIQKLWSEYKETQTVPATSNKRAVDADDRSAVQANKKQKVNENPGEAAPAFQKGVIVLVTNVHVKSSKTVVKQLLEQAGVSVAFLNYKKGVPSVHARLESSEDAQTLASYYEQHKVIQEHGNDATGKEVDPSTAAQHINVRVISGKEEQIYWEQDEQRKKKPRSSKASS